MPRDPERRVQLLAAAEAAVNRLGPAVRMEDVAAQAGVTKPILYRHFGGKGGLYEALAGRAARELQERLETTLQDTTGPRARLRATIGAFLASVEERPQLYRFLVQRAAAERPEVEQAVGEFMSQFASRVAAVIADEFAAVGVDVDEPELLAHVVFGSVQAAADRWLATGEPSRTEVEELLVTLLWQGLPALARTP